jgi:hypothetical protein
LIFFLDEHYPIDGECDDKVAAKGFSKFDDFANSPIPALRFLSLPLWRTPSAPRGTRFARLDLGLFTKSSILMTFYEFIKTEKLKHGVGSWL